MFPYFLLTSVLCIELTLAFTFLRHENLVASLLTTLIHKIKCCQYFVYSSTVKLNYSKMSIMNKTGKLCHKKLEKLTFNFSCLFAFLRHNELKTFYLDR